MDAVVVVPGIMGSELRDANGTVVWGTSKANWLVRAWSGSHGMDRLHLDERERERVSRPPTGADDGRIRAVRLLRSPVFAPLIGGVEPYRELVRRVRAEVARPEDLLEFPYDWRLPVRFNAMRLARRAALHLAECRARWDGAGARPRLVFVAHSMGGLLVRALALEEIREGTDLDPAADIRAVMTLGTPFHGAVKAAVILNTGRGVPVPLPRHRVRRLALTLPGIHDLLPIYRCLDRGESVDRLAPADVAALGGDAALAAESFSFHERLRAADVPWRHRALVGIEQPTSQSLRLRDGVVEALHRVHDPGGGGWRDDKGDGTVYTGSALLGADVQYVPQQHGQLGRRCAVEAQHFVRNPEGAQAPPMGEGELGLDVPDLVEPGALWEVRFTGADGAEGVECRVFDLESDRPDREIDMPTVYWRDGGARADVVVPSPGLYRIEAESNGTSTVGQLVLAVHDETGPYAE